MGNLRWFHDSGIHQVTEMDWWQDVQYEVSIDADHVQQQSKSECKESEKGSSLVISARVSCLPAQHTTGRTPFGTDKTLWASWGFKSPDESSPDPPSVYFAGDTGYRGIPTCSLDESTEDIDDDITKYGDLSVCPTFAQIGELRGPFSLGLIPIGAYAPRALMAGIHASPLDAVEIMKDTRCKKALAMHWGTWVMGAEDVREPPALLRKALSASGLRETGTFDVLGIGESSEFD
jgi:N-acyl-phosphatidylethanolamine-hydrolysing phospholipase D